jgi:D-glycero-alpha-D-manno-heptose-7-phosphate kinase
MIVTKTPLRVSFIGGGTDYKQFFQYHPGFVLGCTVNLNVYVSLLKLPEFAREQFRFTYRRTESVMSIAEIKHPVTRSLLQLHKWETPLNIATMADVPGSSGLGSSSAFTVGLELALQSFRGVIVNPKELAKTAIQIERGILLESGGFQDQYHAAFGGFRSYEFHEDSCKVSENLFNQDHLDDLSRYFTLVFVGNSRDSNFFARATSKFALENSDLLKIVSKTAQKVISNIKNKSSMNEVAQELFFAIDESWEIKKKYSKQIQSKIIESAIQAGKNSGALVAKLCGAGGSGFILFGHSENKQEDIINCFGKEFCVPANFINEGSTLLVK